MENVAVEAALETLVNQFSSAYDCLRELVQNAIDAGSPEIEVWTEFVPGSEGEEGTIVLHVDDYGVGMDENIIDNELTRLFASSKEDDLTKVGKFGIGFVSIFALKPEAVLLHTGRGGSWWEVLFHADRTFTKTKLEVPVEGTQIALYLKGGEERYREVVLKSWQALKFWCRYSDVPITFEDRSGILFQDGVREVNEPFGVRGDLSVSLEKGDTQISLAYSMQPVYGFYNRGLTLAVFQDPDQVPSRFRFVAFEVKSPYLEHTLSRETVLRDENFNKAMKMLERAADDVLFPRLLDRLEELASSSRFEASEQDEYERLLGFFLREREALFRRGADRKIVRLADGQAVTLAEAERRARRRGLVLFASSPSLLVERLARRGYLVVWGRKAVETARPVSVDVVLRAGSALQGVLGKVWGLFGRKQELGVAEPEELFVPVSIVEEPDMSEVLSRAERILGIGKGHMALGRLQAPVAEPPMVLAGEELGELMPAARRVDFQPEHRFLVNRDHPYVDQVARIAPKAPALASALLARGIGLTTGHRGRMAEILSRAFGQEVGS